MTFVEVLVVAWTCDVCGLECLSPDDGLPEGWAVSIDGDRHSCAACVPSHLRGRE